MAVSDRLERKAKTVEPQGNAAARAWHALPMAEIFAALGTGPEGLTSEEAEARKLRFGPNRLPDPRKRNELLRFLQQFHNLLIYVLLAAAALAAAIGHYVDALVVLGVVLLNAIISYLQEGRAERALEAISAMIDPRASVIRDGRRKVVAAEDIVPGATGYRRICGWCGRAICASTRRRSRVNRFPSVNRMSPLRPTQPSVIVPQWRSQAPSSP
jgi:magnesium-transporting ATPase (P-type)